MPIRRFYQAGLPATAAPLWHLFGGGNSNLAPFIDLETLTTDQLAFAIANFAGLNDVIFADYLPPPIAEPLADKRYSI